MVARLILRNLVPLMFLLIVAAALIGCTTAKGSFCQIARPIRLSDAAIDAMSDAEVRAALAQNRQGAALCGWKK